MYVHHFDWSVPLYGVIDKLLDPELCAHLVRSIQEGPWLAATVNGPSGRYENARVRDNDLALLSDPDLHARLEAAVRGQLPAQMFGLPLLKS